MKHTPWKDLNDLSEADLRTRILLPLLQRTPGVEGITDIHGKNEAGLDILFFMTDPIRRTCFGLQLKKGNIGGGGTSKGTVEEVVQQLRLARKLKHPVAVGFPGQHRVERFIVATSGNITEGARREIADTLDEMLIDFWDGHNIIRRVRTHFPELLTGADALTIEYLTAAMAHCDTLDALDQIQPVHKRTLTDIFEEPMLRRKYVSGVTAGRMATSPAPAGEKLSVPPLHAAGTGPVSPTAMLKHTGSSIIIADQNEGKTSLVRMLLLRRARLVLSGNVPDGEGAIPVLVPARDVLATASLSAAIASVLERFGGGELATKLETDFKAGGYLVFVDGFSELPHDSDKLRCEQLVLAFCARYPKVKLVTTGRPGDFLEPRFFTGFHHYTIAAFSDSQVLSLTRKYAKGIADLADVAGTMVGRIREALQLPGSPIPAIIGVMVYDEERRYVTNTAEAVDAYMTIRLGRYAREMGIKQEVEWSRKQDLVAEVAFEMIELGVDGLSRTHFIERFDVVFDRLGEVRRGAIAVEELVQSGVLVAFDESLQFHRTAFRDFFAAHHIFRTKSRDFDDFIAAHLWNKQWGQVLMFAAGLRRHNTELLSRLNALVSNQRDQQIDGDSDYIYGSYLLGRLLTNSEASDATSRIAVLRTCLDAATRSIPEFAAALTRELGNVGELGALIGVEQTMLVTVGVPWLALQFRQLALDKSLSEEERYLIAGVYATLGSDNWLNVLEEVVRDLKSPRVLLVMFGLTKRLARSRKLSATDRDRLKQLEKSASRGLKASPGEVRRLLQYKKKALEVEVKRLQRINAGKKQ